MAKLFNDKIFWKNAIRLSVPVALQNLLTSSFTLADTLLVSRLGNTALSSVGMIGQWTWLMTMVLVGFCSGTTVFISQYWGIKDIKRAKRVAGISMSFALGVGILFTVISVSVPHLVIRMFNSDSGILSVGSAYLKIVAFSYIPVALTNILAAVLRSVENVKLPMYASLFSTVLNIFLDYSMIFGKFGFAKMGVRGAALATVISAWLGVFLIILISVFEKNILIGRPKEFFAFSKDEVSDYIKKALPVVINEGMWGAGTFVYNIIFGNMGYEYFSAITIVRSFENICFVIFIGLCSAAAVMIGKSIGMGDIERGILDSKRFAVIVTVLSVTTSVLIVVFRSGLINIFNMGSNISELTLNTANAIMIIYAIAFPFRIMPYLLIVSVFRSGGDTVTGTRLELTTLWALSVPATLIAVYVLKVPFVAAYAIMYIFEDIPKNIMAFKFYFSKKWIKPVTKEGKLGLKKLRGDTND